MNKRNRRVVTAAALLAALSTPLAAVAEDHFTPVIEHAGDLVANAGGYVVNQKRVAVQRELSGQSPTPAELGVQLPPKSALKLERNSSMGSPVIRLRNFVSGADREHYPA
jgi:hypothetical protein